MSFAMAAVELLILKIIIFERYQTTHIMVLILDVTLCSTMRTCRTGRMFFKYNIRSMQDITNF